MTIWQAIYYFGFLFFAGTLYSSSLSWSSPVCIIFVFPAKILTLFWSSIIITLVTYMLFYRKYFNVRPYIFGLNVFSAIFAIIAGVLGAVYNGSDPISVGVTDTVATITTVLVAYNILLGICNVVKLRLLNIPSNSRIRVFVFALLGYPTMQIIARLPTIVYLYVYGYYFLYLSQSQSVGQTVALYISYVTSPTADIGFLIVFLYTQEGSFDVFMDFVYSLVGLTWRVKVDRPAVFHQDTAFFSTSIRRVNSISGAPSMSSNRHDLKTATSSNTVIPGGSTVSANMNDDFGVAPASTTTNVQDEEAGDTINYPQTENKASSPDACGDATVALYNDLFDKFQEEPLLNQYT